MSMIINNIVDLLPAIEGRSDFIVVPKDGYTFIDYVYIDKDTFDDPRRLECRGIKFGTDGVILARPFKKFFNVGEKEQAHEIDISKPHIITEKLDGSMIHPAMLGDDLVLMTRKGVTDVAKRAAKQFLWRPEYSGFMLHCIKNGVTPIFEYVGPDNRIVLRYDEPSLVLLAIRENVSGTLFPSWNTWANAQVFDIPYASVPEFTADVLHDMAGFMEHVRGLENAEGYVITFDDGHMLKIKAEDYVLKHRALDDMGSKKKVLALVLQGFVDDVLPILDDADREELIQFQNDIQSEIYFFILRVKHHVAQFGSYERKRFATEFLHLLTPSALHPAAFDHLDGRPVRQAVLRAMCGKNMNSMKTALEVFQTKWRGE